MTTFFGVDMKETFFSDILHQINIIYTKTAIAVAAYDFSSLQCNTKYEFNL